MVINAACKKPKQAKILLRNCKEKKLLSRTANNSPKSVNTFINSINKLNQDLTHVTLDSKSKAGVRKDVYCSILEPPLNSSIGFSLPFINRTRMRMKKQ